MKTTSEAAFETFIENQLIGKGWEYGSVSNWDRELALFPSDALRFLEETQKPLMAQMRKLHAEQLPEMLTATLRKELDTKGTLHVLRHGFKFYGKVFRMAYFKPAHGLNPEQSKRYDENLLTVTRQVLCHPSKKDTTDVVLSLNGIPVSTMELKTEMKHQTWHDAVHQYKTDRDPGAPLFRFKTGAVVHFAVDSMEVHMCTKLNREQSFFLPFNRGSHPGEITCGAGNPEHPSGHRTAYLWETVLQRDSWLDILGSFLFIETEEKVTTNPSGKRVKTKKETLIFPRYHQLDAVRMLVSRAKKEEAGSNYLVQHSAGSGKTNSISWLSHRLASLHTDTDKKVFDCVVVITDRQVLDKQLQDAIYQIEHAQGVVKPIDKDSKQLAEALIDGTRIVITTLQKFPFVLKGLLRAAGATDTDKPDADSLDRASAWQQEIAKRNYAIIVDEAHSSQTGETARELKEILGGGSGVMEGDEAEDWEDRLNEIMESRGQQRNLSFFAFTATPKGKTIQLFGQNNRETHLYSMRQAIQEGFIKDVLKHYTTLDTFIKLRKATEDDPDVPKRKANQELGRFISLHPTNVDQRTRLMVEHFRQTVQQRIGGHAKAMLVTGSRLHAVKYMLAFEKYIKEKAYKNIRPMVAFSGKVTDPDTDLEYTEPNMNRDVVSGKPILEKQLPEKFASDDFQILLVANKYQTGFDQPLLHTMYVDKRLDGVQAVQTLSRLNRTHPGKDDPFVLDFVNSMDDIYKAFKPYYDATELEKPTDPQLLEELKHELMETRIIEPLEIEEFAKVFYKDVAKHRASDHASMEKHLQSAVTRYQETEDEEARTGFKEKLNAYVRLYAFMSQILPYGDRELEMLYSYGRLLLPHLPTLRDKTRVDLKKDVQLQYYRMETSASGSIVLEEGERYGVKSPSEVGTGRTEEEKKPLSVIIEGLNDKFGTEFSEEDRLFFEQLEEKAMKSEKVVQTALANPKDKFLLVFAKLLGDLMIERMGDNDEIVTRYLDNQEFQNTVVEPFGNHMYERIREKV